MASLSDKDILELIRLGSLSISPLQISNIQPGSIDLTLADSIELFKIDKTVDLSELSKDDLKRASEIISISDGYELKPGPVSYTHLDVYKRQVLTFLKLKNRRKQISFNSAKRL